MKLTGFRNDFTISNRKFQHPDKFQISSPNYKFQITNPKSYYFENEEERLKRFCNLVFLFWFFLNWFLVLLQIY